MTTKAHCADHTEHVEDCNLCFDAEFEAKAERDEQALADAHEPQQLKDWKNLPYTAEPEE